VTPRARWVTLRARWVSAGRRWCRATATRWLPTACCRSCARRAGSPSPRTRRWGRSTAGGVFSTRCSTRRSSALSPHAWAACRRRCTLLTLQYTPYSDENANANRWWAREWSLNEGQIPNLRGVRVHVSTGCNLVEGNRRASRTVSDPPPETYRHDSQLFSIAVYHVRFERLANPVRMLGLGEAVMSNPTVPKVRGGRVGGAAVGAR
jgi:hypothetical protein